MLENLPQNLSRHLFHNSEFKPIPDPWTTPSEEAEAAWVPPVWNAGRPARDYPLEATESEVLLIAAPPQRSELWLPQALVQWGLKLKADDNGPLAQSLQQALALALWPRSRLSPMQVLLQDELKLKALTDGTLKAQVQNALALLLLVRSRQLLHSL
jgi:hypothetical protein